MAKYFPVIKNGGVLFKNGLPVFGACTCCAGDDPGGGGGPGGGPSGTCNVNHTVTIGSVASTAFPEFDGTWTVVAGGGAYEYILPGTGYYVILRPTSFVSPDNWFVELRNNLFDLLATFPASGGATICPPNGNYPADAAHTDPQFITAGTTCVVG